MGEQHRAGYGDGQGKHHGRLAVFAAVHPHPPFEQDEQDDEQREDAVLRYFRIAQGRAAIARKISGQCLAHRPQRKCSISARRPMSMTKMPAQWWLYSDHAISAALRGKMMPSPGT